MKKSDIKTFGKLEAKIMDKVWRLGNCTVRQVLNNFKGKKKPAYTTVMTVMDRLYKKKVLKRSTNNDAYVYMPTQDKESFFASKSQGIIKSLINHYGKDTAVAGFLEVLEEKDEQEVEELRKKLKKIIQ